MTTLPTTPDLETIRSHFPALAQETIYLENAGGSQVPRIVAEAMQRYMLEHYVQLGAPYEVSRRSTQTVQEAHAFVNRFVGGEGAGTTILGASATQLTYMLADCYAEIVREGDEIIIAETGHETNIGPWVRLEKRVPGVNIRWWRVDPEALTCPLDELDDLLNDRTRLVAFPHVSNLLGEIVDVKAITQRVHEAGARVVVDGVAYAPHRAINVADWNVDWYMYSTYKVYGPHMGALYGRADAIEELTGPNHFFIPKDDVPYKFELGGVSHEGCAGLLGFGAYLNALSGESADQPVTRDTIERAFEIMTACELPAQQRLLEYLRSRSDVRVIGPAHGEAGRVGTISFVHGRLSAASIARAVCDRGIGIRHGHMYAYRLCEALGIQPEDGVVRVSLVHYSTVQEIERLLDVLDEVLAGHEG